MQQDLSVSGKTFTGQRENAAPGLHRTRSGLKISSPRQGPGAGGNRSARGSARHFSRSNSSRSFSAENSDSDKEEDDEEGDEGMTLEMKARTLGYQLPSAEMELLRIDEMRRAFDEKLSLRKRNLPSTQVNLASWLERHPDVTLRELDLADSSKAVRSISVEDSLGTGRYVMRGELRQWMDRVEKLNNEMRLDARDWDSDDEREIDDILNAQMKMMLTSETVNRKKAITDLTLKMANMLTFVAEQDMSIDERLYPDEEAKLKCLAVSVQKWYEHVKKYGHPRQIVESTDVRAPTEEELRRRKLEQGVSAAAASQGIILQPHQVDQVLAAFYEQEQPESMKKKDKSRVERRLVESLSREESKTASFRNAISRQQETIETLEATVYKQMVELAELKASGKSELRDPTAVENMNFTTRAVAEALAKKKIQESNAVVEEVTAEMERLRTSYNNTLEDCRKLAQENATLQARVVEIDSLWNAHLEHIRQKEEERSKLFGGQKDDKAHFISTVSSVIGNSISSFTALLLLVTKQDRALLRGDQYAAEQVKRVDAVEEWIATANSTLQQAQAQLAERSAHLKRHSMIRVPNGMSFHLPASLASQTSGQSFQLSRTPRSGTFNPPPAVIPGVPMAPESDDGDLTLATSTVIDGKDKTISSALSTFNTLGGTDVSGFKPSKSHARLSPTSVSLSAPIHDFQSGQVTPPLDGAMGPDRSPGINAISPGRVVPPAVATAIAIERRELSEFIAQRKSERCGLNDARAIVREWCRQMERHMVTDGLRVAVKELADLCEPSEAADDSAMTEGLGSPGQAHGSKAAVDHISTHNFPRVALRDIDLQKEHAEAVGHRLDTALSELRAKFREERFMRSAIKYFTDAVEAMCNGTYDDAIHAKRTFDDGMGKEDAKNRFRSEEATNGKEEHFPPDVVTSPDAEYSYAWSEELKSMESCFLQLRHTLCDAGERVDASSAIINAIDALVEDRNQSGRNLKRKVQVQQQMSQGGGTDSSTANTSTVLPPLKAIPSTAAAGNPLVPATMPISGNQAKMLHLLHNMEPQQYGPDASSVNYEAIKRGDFSKKGLYASSGTSVTPGAATLADVHRRVMQTKDPDGSQKAKETEHYLDVMQAKQVPVPQQTSGTSSPTPVPAAAQGPKKGKNLPLSLGKVKK